MARIISAVKDGGPAATAGLAVGDAIVSIGKQRFHSGDSLLDYLAVTKPGTRVAVEVRRARTYEKKVLEITLGTRTVAVPGIRWQYAGLEQLDAALAAAKKQNKRLLIGITGAET